MAPAGTPAPIVARLNETVNAILARPDTREAQLRAGAEPMPMTPAGFDTFLRADIGKQGDWIRMAGMTAG